MDVAELLHLPGDSGRVTCRAFMLAVNSGVLGQGVLVRQGVADARLLTAIRETELDWELVSGRAVVTADNPFLNNCVRGKLDASGLMPEGTTLEPGDVVFSAYRIPLAQEVEGEPPPGMRWADDCSGWVPSAWQTATLTSLRRSAKRIEATLRAEDDLAVGDALLLEHGLVAVVAGFVADVEMPVVDGVRPDLLVSERLASSMALRPEACRRFDVSRLAGSAGVLQACAEAPLSIITRQPIESGPNTPQPINQTQVRWLRSRGLDANLAELVCTKCDDWRPRRHRVADVAASPESLWTFRAHLAALGLEVALTSGGRHVEMTLRPATPEAIRAASSGEVRKPDTLNYRTYQPEPGGLFCPAVFGPETSTRRRRFGHIELPFPVVSPLWRYGDPAGLERLLGLSSAEVDEVLGYGAALWRRDGGVTVEPLAPHEWRAAAQETDFLGVGGEGVRALLGLLPPDRIPPALADRPTALVLEALPVPPPDIRPLVLLDNGNFATSDLNDHYRRVVNRSRRLDKLRDLNAPEAILLNEARMLQQTVDALFANCLLPDRGGAVLGSEGRRLHDLLSLTLHGLTEDRSKRVAWSGRACAIQDASVGAEEVRVPPFLRLVLRLETSRPLLLTNPDDPDGAFVALRTVPHNEPVLRLPPTAFTQLHFDLDRPAACAVHVPLSAAAVGEAERLVRGDPGRVHSVPEAAGWIDAGEQQAILSALCEAALTASTARLESPRGLMIAGPGIVDVPEDVPQEASRPDVRAVPIPNEPPKPRRRRRRED